MLLLLLVSAVLVLGILAYMCYAIKALDALLVMCLLKAAIVLAWAINYQALVWSGNVLSRANLGLAIIATVGLGVLWIIIAGTIVHIYVTTRGPQ